VTSLFAILKAVFTLFGLFICVLFFWRGRKTSGPLGARKTACLIFVALFYLFFRGVGDHGLLDPIEGTNASVALNMAMRKNFAVPMVGDNLYFGNSMGFWWLSALSLSIFSWSEFSVRLWSVIGGLGIAVAGWLLALRTGGERSANYAAVLIGSSTLVYITSQLASPHALYAFWVTMSLVGTIYAFRDERFFILTHASAMLAFVVYGPAGAVLPWLSFLVYAVLAEQERFLVRALFYWPGLLVTVLIGGGYIFFLKARNPYILTFMMHNIPSETFNSASLILAFLAVGFFPWPGMLPGAVRSALPLHWGLILPSEKQNILLLAWSGVFLFFGAFSKDALLLVASLPAMAVLCANHLAKAVEKKDSFIFQKAVALEIIMFALFFFVALPWFFAAGDNALRNTLASVIFWAVFCLLFLLAGWYYAKTRQPRKLMLFLSMISLFSLLPLAGVFVLLGESFSVRDAGLYLRNEVKQGDLLVQYALNHPSIFFYVGNPGLTSSLIHVAANEKITGQDKDVVDDTALNKMWEGEKRVFMLINRQQKILTPLPQSIHDLYQAQETIILSNQRSKGPTAVPGSFP